MTKVVVDTNIVFSAILNSQGKVGQIILNGSNYFDFYSVYQLKKEIIFHKAKILALSGYDEKVFSEIFNLILSKIAFIDDILLTDSELKNAIDLVAGIDENDMMFVALANHLNSILWTGDKKLINGLHKKGYSQTISTMGLYEKYLQKYMLSKMKK